jgi:hypothetical protein
VSRNGIRSFKRRSVAMFGWSRPSWFNSEGTTTGRLKEAVVDEKHQSKLNCDHGFFLLMVMWFQRKWSGKSASDFVLRKAVETFVEALLQPVQMCSPKFFVWPIFYSSTQKFPQ